MDRRRIGSLDVSVVGLGCNNFGWRIDERQAAAVIDAALDAGVNFLDTAELYADGKSEEYIGRALQGRREQVVIATKFGHRSGHPDHGAHPDHIPRALEGSLKRLRTDHVDLYQLHTPDPGVPIEDTLGALDRLVAEGKAREVGCSNFDLGQLAAADAVQTPHRVRFASVQNHFNLLERQDQETVQACARDGRAYLPYYPLASGLLTGKYRLGAKLPEGTRITEAGRYNPLLSEENLRQVERLVEYAELHGRTVLDLAFAWLLSWPAVSSVIAGSTSPAQIRANAEAAGWRLSTLQREEVDRLLGSIVH